MSGQRNKSKISFLGIFLGIMWAAITILIMSGVRNYDKNNDAYKPKLSYITSSLEQQQFAYFRRTVTNLKEAGYTSDDSTVHAELFATADHIDALVSLVAYRVGHDEEMGDRYLEKVGTTYLEMGDLSFLSDEINARFFDHAR